VAELGLEHLGFSDEVFKLFFLPELETLGGAGIGTAGYRPLAAIEQVGAAGAFLGDIEVFVEEYGIIGAGIDTGFTAGALFRMIIRPSSLR
jgi:hypothetical protein